MANIFQRFKDIMSANINALLDKAEDPARMVDQYLRNLEDDLGNVKAQAAAVMAEETKAKRKLDECGAEIEKMTGYAQKALQAGNEEDARAFLEKKAALTEEQKALQQAFDAAAANADKMKQMHEKLTKDIEELQRRKETIKTKVAVAKTQQTINDLTEKVAGAATGNLDAFSKMEQKADEMLDRANAMAELNTSEKESTLEELEDKYDSPAKASVDAELEAMKKELGL